MQMGTQTSLGNGPVSCRPLSLVALAFLIHYSLRSVLSDHLVFTAFLPAARLASLFGGLVPGLVALVLGFLLGDFFFLPPRFEFVPRGATRNLAV